MSFYEPTLITRKQLDTLRTLADYGDGELAIDSLANPGQKGMLAVKVGLTEYLVHEDGSYQAHVPGEVPA